VAQLEARLDGIEEVEGSNPFGSTKFIPSAGSPAPFANKLQERENTYKAGNLPAVLVSNV
jgi:hypothetical protein